MLFMVVVLCCFVNMKALCLHQSRDWLGRSSLRCAERYVKLCSNQCTVLSSRCQKTFSPQSMLFFRVLEIIYVQRTPCIAFLLSITSSVFVLLYELISLSVK